MALDVVELDLLLVVVVLVFELLFELLLLLLDELEPESLRFNWE